MDKNDMKKDLLSLIELVEETIEAIDDENDAIGYGDEEDYEKAVDNAAECRDRLANLIVRIRKTHLGQ